MEFRLPMAFRDLLDDGVLPQVWDLGVLQSGCLVARVFGRGWASQRAVGDGDDVLVEKEADELALSAEGVQLHLVADGLYPSVAEEVADKLHVEV